MGLSIHFSGRLRQAEYLPAMIAEIVDVSNVYGWKFHIHESHIPDNSFENRTTFENVYGISFTPTNCETISLAFLSNGTMVCPFRIPFFAHSENETERSYIYFISVKTQFAGVTVHLLLMRLFKYLENKYFEGFKLDDESYYWETGDEKLMRERFKLYDDLLDNVVLSIQTFPMEQGEDIIPYFERLMKHIDNLKKSE
jgi:hypothetical protein